MSGKARVDNDIDIGLTADWMSRSVHRTSFAINPMFVCIRRRATWIGGRVGLDGGVDEFADMNVMERGPLIIQLVGHYLTHPNSHPPRSGD